jgi:hypothetical protein
MAEKLSDLFEAARGPVIEWRGQVVHAMYEIAELAGSAVLKITFADPSPARPQGLRLKAQGGRLEINDQLHGDVVLWSDSAPSVVVAVAHPKRGKVMSLRLWNAWRDPAGTTQAWIGNAGMLVEGDLEQGLVLRCSDGFDEPTFDDLVATLVVTEEAARSS